MKGRIGAVAAQSLSLVGTRRSGKSSVLRYIKERIGEFCSPAQRPLVASISLQFDRFHHPAGIIEGLRREIERETGNCPWQQHENDDPFAVDEGLERLRDQGYRLIVSSTSSSALGRG